MTKNRIRYDKSKKSKKNQVLLVITIAIFLILFGILFLAIDFYNTSYIAKSPEEYDDWCNQTGRKMGDTITVNGIIDIKEINPFGTGYLYSFKNSDNRFLSGEDIGDKGDNIIVTIEIDNRNLPTVQRINNNNFLYLSAAFIILGSVTMIGTGLNHIIQKKYNIKKNDISKDLNKK